ncbi:MAG: YidC/Oxa1 family membrane protein insertase [Ruminococcus sp.]|nr:YidC/Oxa1 family membrane protein insertase [Ruminococcus sp.]
MSTLYDIIGIPFGYLMSWIYQLVPNYAIAIIVFTLVTKLLLFPVNYKTQKDSARMRLLQPKLQKIQKSFANNTQRQQEETMKLYQEEGINQMASCLPMFVQMFLLFGVIDVVYKPITHILHITKSVRTAAIEVASNIATEFGIINGGKTISSGDLRNELHIIEALNQYPEKFSNLSENFENIVSEFSQRFTIFGANLGQTPTLHPETWNSEAIVLVCIPFLAGIAQLITSIYSMIYQQKNNPNPQAGGGCMWIMMLGMPLLSIWWGFTFPAAVGFYWIWSSVFSFLITLGLNIYFTPERIDKINKKEKEKARIYAEKHPEKKTFMQRMLEASAEQGQNSYSGANIDKNGEKMSRSEQNKANRDTLKDARKRMAEKYGDDYDENDK